MRPTELSLYSQSKHRARIGYCYSTITIPTTDTQYKFSPSSEHNMEPEQLQIILVMLVCLCKRHYILSLDYLSTLLLHDSRYDILLMKG